jgi:serine/threonine protein phosphatase PrpC
MLAVSVAARPASRSLEGPAGARLVMEALMEAPERFEFGQGLALFHSERSPDKDSPNEDAAALIPLDGARALLAVADGMGGRPLGAEASRTAVEQLFAAASAAEPGAPMRAVVLDALEHANHELVERGVGAATTAAVVEIDEGWLRSYHVGDSAIFVVGQRGRVKAQTVAHSPVGYAVEAGLLDESEAMHHEERHLVSNMVGAADMRIEMGSRIKLARRDTVLLATDGLVDNLDPGEIADIIRVGPLERAAERLVTTARTRMRDPREGEPSKADDMTFILYRRSV